MKREKRRDRRISRGEEQEFMIEMEETATVLRAATDRRQLTGEVNAPTAWVSSAEDIVLQKLLWFEKGGRISTQQWDDISGVLKVSAKILDFDYLVQWSSELGLTELLHKAYLDAGITPDNNHL